jgi:hypothetical protein
VEILRFNIAAGETKIFVKAGRYFEVVTAASPVDVGFYDGSGTQTEDARQVTSGFYARLDYSQLEIRSDTAQAIELLVSRAEAGSKQLPGVVRVVDQSFAKTLAGSQFYIGTSYPAQAGEQAVISLRLTAAGIAAGKRLGVRRITIGSTTAGDVVLGSGSAPGTATNIGTTRGNKLLQATPTAALVSAHFATSTGDDLSAAEMPGWSRLGSLLAVQANSSYTLEFAEPLVITGTVTLAVIGRVLNRQLNAAFEGEEF